MTATSIQSFPLPNELFPGGITYDVRSDLAAHDSVHSNHFCGIGGMFDRGKRGDAAAMGVRCWVRVKVLLRGAVFGRKNGLGNADVAGAMEWVGCTATRFSTCDVARSRGEML
jgi:hypothetical protein